MRAILFSLSCLLFCGFTAQAQNQVSAESIIAQLNAGESINLENTTITGMLDFTAVDDQRPDRNSDYGGDDNVRSTVRQAIRFSNCRFEGRVLGYVHIDKRTGAPVSGGNNWTNNNRTFLRNADFQEAVAFENCTFEEEVNFKYTTFVSAATFEGSEFEEETGFKYTEFNRAASFIGVIFGDEATFKYTEFEDATSFAGALFEGDATFKYTEFNGDTDLSRVVFRDEAIFKYVDFPSNTNMDGTDWGPKADFKYAKLGNRDFRG
ncbi:MAG: pentapeptide repeat-containing protein [Bacteroidota bacterium]